MQLVHDLLNGTAATDGGHEAPCALGALPDAAAVGSWVPISPAAVHLQLELLRPDKGAAARVHLYTVMRLPLTAIDCHCVDLRSDPVGAAVRLGGSQLLGCREGAGARGISVADVSAGRPLVLRGRLGAWPALARWQRGPLLQARGGLEVRLLIRHTTVHIKRPMRICTYEHCGTLYAHDSIYQDCLAEHALGRPVPPPTPPTGDGVGRGLSDALRRRRAADDPARPRGGAPALL
jgi:hypothetical protein